MVLQQQQRETAPESHQSSLPQTRTAEVHAPRPCAVGPQLEPERMNALLVGLEQEAHDRRTQHRLLCGLLTGCFVFGASNGLWLGRGNAAMDWLTIYSGLALVFTLFGSRLQREAAHPSARMVVGAEDIRSVGALAEALAFTDYTIRSSAEAALIRLLPRVQATDAFLLNEAQRDCLARTLTGRNIELVENSMKLFARIGDARVMRVVEQIAANPHSHPHLRAVAQDCLPRLQAQAELTRTRQTLLRGSSVAAQPADLLLRPAREDETAPKELLRPF